jgi:hypothetical protein
MLIRSTPVPTPAELVRIRRISVAENENWRRLLRDALAVLALPPDEQVRINSPGCIACDLREDFEHARTVALGSAAATLSDEQRTILDRIEFAVRTMQDPDTECFNSNVLRRPIWQELRELAAAALRIFGWETVTVSPFIEVKPGVWQRPPRDDGSGPIERTEG